MTPLSRGRSFLTLIDVRQSSAPSVGDAVVAVELCLP